MRLFLIVPILIIVSLLALYLLKAITGDGLSAVVLGLTLFISVAAWFAGPTTASGRPSGARP